MRFRLTLLAAAVLLVPTPAAAQVVLWDSPLLAAPQPEAGYGFYLFEPAGADLGLLGTFKGAGSSLRYRLGIADGIGDGIAVLGGVDYSRLLRSRDADFPLDVGWVIGAGLGYQEWLSLSIPFGFSAGVPIQTEDLRFTPFVTPRVVVDAFLDAPEGADGTDLDFAVDIGLDVGIGRTWGLRFGATLGDRDALGIGIVF